MESNVINMLEKQAKHLEDFPVLRQRIAGHASEEISSVRVVKRKLSGLKRFKIGSSKVLNLSSPRFQLPPQKSLGESYRRGVKISFASNFLFTGL